MITEEQCHTPSEYKEVVSASAEAAVKNENGTPIPMLLVKNVAVEENDICDVKKSVRVYRAAPSIIRPIDRQKMRPWLENLLHEGKTPGLKWVMQYDNIFSVLWKHGASKGWNIEKDAQVFQKWAFHTGKNHKESKARWKANFRCALKSLDDVIELRDHHISKGHGAIRVFRFMDKKPSRIGRKLKIAPVPSRTDEQDHVVTSASGLSYDEEDECDPQTSPEIPEIRIKTERIDDLMVNVTPGVSGVYPGDGCDPEASESDSNEKSKDLLMLNKFLLESNHVEDRMPNADVAINQEHSDNILKRLHKLYQSDTLCNVSIILNNGILKAHDLVLCVNSAGFEDQICSLRNAFDNVQNIELFFGDDYNTAAMESIVEYFYTSKISISNLNVWLLLPLSNLLDVEDVRERCCEYLRFRLVAPLIIMLKSLLNNPILQKALNTFCKEGHTESIKKMDKTIDHFVSSHARRILESINLARKFEKFCDLVVLVKEERLIVHGAILAAQSEYLCNKISVLMCRSLLPAPVLELNDFTAETFSAVIQFFYTGNMTIDIKTVILILSAKEIFQGSTLVKKVSDTFYPHSSMTNCLQSCLRSWPHLKQLCRKIIKDNFEQFINDDSFLSLRLHDLLQVAYELSVVSNIHLCKGVIAWLEHKPKERNDFETYICRKLKINRVELRKYRNMYS